MIYLDVARQSAQEGSRLLSTEALTSEIISGGESPARRFDPGSAAPFVNKSVSEATRRAYGRALREFFQFGRMKHPAEVVPADVLLWRDRLRSRKKSASTVAFKLSVVRSFFEYLKAAGVVTLNPASAKLVSPPELPSEPAGRALSAKEVRYLLSGPDREKAEGARDYALMLVMLRLSLRVSEVCSHVGFVRKVESRPLDAAVQGQRGEGGGLAAPQRGQGGG